MDFEERFQRAAWIAEEYKNFIDFAEAGMKFLGFDLTDVQADIAEFMQSGPRLRMVMAQRGEAKSTLAALYAVWRLIQDPTEIVLVVSGGEAQASEVANLIIRMIMQWDLLEHLRPDRQAGDRTSFTEFDIHWALKGINKSPSVSCYGITANLQGKRATLLIPDDIETTKNGLTPTTRGQLLRLTKEFTSINTHGDILYLGTPQTKDSVYNSLPKRGFEVRIWPGRYPTASELPRYAGHLAPRILALLQLHPEWQTGGGLDGKRGRPTDPARYTETALQEKELDQGPETFQLQYMLDTTLSDALRLQLKLHDLVVANYDIERLPEFMVWQQGPAYLVPLPEGFSQEGAKLYNCMVPNGVEWKPRPAAMCYIDPAGGGSDELAYGISVAHGAYIHVLDVGGLVGGLTEQNGETLVALFETFNVTHCQVESNMGHGLFETSLKGIIAKAKSDKKLTHDVGVAGEYSVGQKERRIIDSLVSALQRHRIVLHNQVLISDVTCGAQHSQDKRQEYSLFYQLENITTERGCLTHDDRVEAFAGCVRWHKAVLEKDAAEEARKRAEAAAKQAMLNPMGYEDPEWVARNQNNHRGIRRSIHARRGRR